MKKTRPDPPPEKRTVPRYALQIPVELEQGRGKTRDISSHGVSFDTGEHVALGPIRAGLVFHEHQPDEWRLYIEGEVVRVAEGRVAVNVDSFGFEGSGDFTRLALTNDPE